MTEYLERVRRPDRTGPAGRRIAVSAGIAALGFALGIFQKWLDGSAANELPVIFQRLDFTNFFGRFAVWIFLGAVISVCAATPARAGLNTFLFLGCMVLGYYVYGQFVLGFFPRSYAMIWAVLACVSPVPAAVCWYAKGRGWPAVVISAGILGCLLSQAIGLVQGLRVLFLPEVIVWAAAVVILRRRDWKEFAWEMGLSVVVAAAVQVLLPFWG
ncbi:MAG: hypothetical protein IJR36_01120 [Lachnospiraceae bacterium]|nr:hypothetical protein [Lachnospiraceae bacterium]